jgi:glutathione S-transferase
MRPWLALTHAGADFETQTVEVPLGRDARKDDEATLRDRRTRGSVTGLFPVLHVGGEPIHESLAICEWAHESFPHAGLWPEHPLDRARARAISSEMASGFSNMRTHMSCHLFGSVEGFVPDAATRREIARVFELWSEALARSGGPFLFGRFGIADAMYFPIRTRLRTYGVAIPEALGPYVAALDAHPAVRSLVALARSAPRIPAYDAALRALGGDPDALLEGGA